ncbi:class I SAM-dependent methyltransferase [Brachybacterium sacelli]|uniref:16S rRNA (Guanine1207-N2)-methyltransferase n=1 Tax=Brachybacterium sacelli TaxID=173364 RepID=A0ABS4X683_9MICO|nr:methyltransferase [Brachybacterium sacelli]MBP2383229.1 16S rRNA (guanine1207-N2)-methyltransferase [Brachybacterium sacelli]
MTDHHSTAPTGAPTTDDDPSAAPTGALRTDDDPSPAPTTVDDAAASGPVPEASAPHGPDQTDRVILRTAAEEAAASGPGAVLVVDDATGELTAAALAEVGTVGEATSAVPGTPVISWTASHAATLALRARFSEEVTEGRLEVPGGDHPASLAEIAAETRPRLALMRLPKALADLEHRAVEIARAGDVTLVAGGRVKHMTRTQNVVLGGVFTEVHASRGLGKSRALVATAAREDLAPLPIARGTAHLPVRGTASALELRAIGGVFGGATADAGSLLLLEALDRHLLTREEAEAAPLARAIDLGSGNGLLTAYLAAALPETPVLGSDDDADAVASTRATLDAYGLDRESTDVTWDDSLFRVADRSADLVLLNPPFHDGTAVDATLVQGLLDAVARVLRPGGELWFVHNSSLRYRTEVERRIGPVRQRARDRRFTVLSAERT